MHHRPLLCAALLLLGSTPAARGAEGTIYIMARVLESGPGVLADSAGRQTLAGGPADQMLSDGMARIRLELVPADGWPGPARVTIEFVAN
jgi:hypothetical protein